MEKFHFNPIPLTRETRKYFTSLETLHVYNRGDCEFREEYFYKRIIHYDVGYQEYLRKREDKDIFLHVVSGYYCSNSRETPHGISQ